MAEVQMLFSMEPKEFWRQLRGMIEEVMEQKNISEANRQLAENTINKTLLKATEVCELFKVSKPTIYDWMRQGKLKSFKIRSRRYFLLQDVEDLIKSSRAKT